MQIRMNGHYLTRTARAVGIVHDRGPGQVWRWLTTRGYYVQADGRATGNPGGQCSADLVREVAL